jgi:hypothetical protein
MLEKIFLGKIERMVNHWIKLTPLNPPPQGKKIVCFKKGDLWIARRLNHKGVDYYLEIQYDGKGSILTETPEYWIDTWLPEKYTGYMKVSVDDGPLLTFDELQQQNAEYHENFIEPFIKNAVDAR